MTLSQVIVFIWSGGTESVCCFCVLKHNMEKKKTQTWALLQEEIHTTEKEINVISLLVVTPQTD